MINELGKNRQEQRQREREARLQSARLNAERHRKLARTMGDEGWEAVEKEMAQERGRGIIVSLYIDIRRGCRRIYTRLDVC